MIYAYHFKSQLYRSIGYRLPVGATGRLQDATEIKLDYITWATSATHRLVVFFADAGVDQDTRVFAYRYYLLGGPTRRA